MQKISTPKKTHFLILTTIFSMTLGGSIFWFMSPPIVTKGYTEEPIVQVTPILYPDNHVVINLNDMTLILRNGTTTLTTFPILSQGKPGSYYETIGGAYTSDYKIPLHFSSIGHVYMPHSVHVFGNYFIHGIPYYPNGTPVSSTYSGGCIRLQNEHAKIVYDFITKETPIVVTRVTESSFTPTASSSYNLTSSDMTNLMVAAISLEALTQDNEIIGLEQEVTTRRKILPKLLIDKNPSVANLYAKSLGEETFVSLMNKKARALGLSNTHFIDVISPVLTTYEDHERFMSYVRTYKSYLIMMQTRPDDRSLR